MSAPDRDSTLCQCGHMRGIHKAATPSPCATAACGCEGFRKPGAPARPEPPRVIPGRVLAEEFKPYVHGATTGHPSPARPEKVLAAINAGVTEAGRTPAPSRQPRDQRETMTTTTTAAGRDQQPGAAAANLGTHLRAKLRSLGWTPAGLSEKSGLSAHITGRALNGNGADLAVAEQLATLTGGYLATMIGPYHCSTCQGEQPPQGYSCLECGASTPRSLP